MAITPEELETLLEDAFVTHDATALAALFAEGAVVCDDNAIAFGREDAVRAIAATWSDRTYFAADPIAQRDEVAVVFSDATIAIMRRGARRRWRYVFWANIYRVAGGELLAKEACDDEEREVCSDR